MNNVQEKDSVPAIRFIGFMDDWEQRKVGEFYDFKNGLNKGKEFFGSGTPIVNFTDVFHNRGIYAKQLNGKVNLEPSEIANYEVRKGDIFFTRTSETVEEIGYPSVMLDDVENTVFSGFVLRGRSISKEDPLDNLFKKYVFFTEAFRQEMTKKSSMTTRALTSGTAIKGMLFRFPISKDEQYQIGAYFTSLDRLITLHQRKYSRLCNIKKSMLERMFPREGATVPEIRFTGFTDDWEQRKLGEIAEKTFGGGTPNTSNEAFWNGKIPWIQSSDVTEGKVLELQPKKYITTDGLNKSAAQLVPANSIAIITRVGVGKLVFVPFSYTTSQDFLSLSKLKTEPFFTVYACYKKIQSELNEVQGTSIKGITKNELLAKEIMVPDYAEQHKIGDYFKNLDHLITLHQRELERLQNMKKACFEKMFV